MLGEEIAHGTDQRSALGSVLLEESSVRKSGFWATDAPTIRTRLSELQTRYVAIGKRLEQGGVGWPLLAVSSLSSSSSSLPSTTPSNNAARLNDSLLSDDNSRKANATGKSAHPTSLAPALAALQRDLIKLFEDNLIARQTLQARASFKRDLGAVHPDLPKTSLHGEMTKTETDGEEAFKSGDFKTATRDFGRAIDQCKRWYLEEESKPAAKPEWLAHRQKQSQDLVQTLQAEKAQFDARIASLTSEIDTHTKTISGLQGQIAQLSAKQLEDQAARKTAETERDAAKLKAKDADATKTALTKATSELDAVKQTAATQREKLDKVEPQLASAIQDRDRFEADAKKWKKLATESPGVVIPFNDKLAEIEKSLGTLDGKNWDAAQAAFVKAGTEYRKLEGERAALVAPNQFEARHPKVRAKDAELAEAADLLTKALKQLDAADKTQHDKLQQQIDSRQKLHDEERATGVAEQNSELVQLRSTIASLKQQQGKHAAGRDRAAGTGKTLTLDDIVKLTGAAQVAVAVLDASNLKPGELRIIKVKGIETRWHWIPPGKFKMGSPSGEQGRDSDEAQVDVTISQGFWMLETEVTQELWTAVMGTTLDWGSYGKGPKHPVYNVSHDEATEFCVKFNTLLKAIPEAGAMSVSLPTEAQWKYAARAGTTTRYYWGDSDAQADQYAWHRGNSSGATQAVGLKKENAWGLKDMSGNVWVWCSDWYGEKLVGGTDPRGAASAADRVVRGGCWFNSVGGGNLRSAVRSGYSPGIRLYDLGLRMASGNK